MSYTVYQHKNKINGKVYIGITAQRSANDRWRNGSAYMGQHFGRAIAKYGWNNFDHIIIATGLTKEDACTMERILIKAYDATNPQKGYNETLGGDGGGMYKKHHTEEAKEKISKARKEIGFSAEHKKHISEAKSGTKHHQAKKVYQYTKDMEFIKEWSYMTEASNELGICKGNISLCCLGKRPSAGGFVWKYEMIAR